MRASDQSSVFSTGGKFHLDYGLLLELHALTLVAHSCALLTAHTIYCTDCYYGQHMFGTCAYYNSCYWYFDLL